MRRNVLRGLTSGDIMDLPAICKTGSKVSIMTNEKIYKRMPAPERERKNERLFVRVTKSGKTHINNLAKKLGMTRTDLILSAIEVYKEVCSYESAK